MSGGPRRAALALAACLAAGAAAAQTGAITTATPQQMAFFRQCRAAVFYHLDRGSAQGGVVPAAFAEALGQQIGFVMWGTIRNAPASTLEQEREAMAFTERFFLSFSQTIAERRDLREDVAAREKLLIDCQPVIWGIVAQEIDRSRAR